MHVIYGICLMRSLGLVINAWVVFQVVATTIVPTCHAAVNIQVDGQKLYFVGLPVVAPNRPNLHLPNHL